MIDLGPITRAGTPDEVATVTALLMGPDGSFITGSDFLINGGVTASYFFGTSGLSHDSPARASSSLAQNSPTRDTGYVAHAGEQAGGLDDPLRVSQ